MYVFEYPQNVRILAQQITSTKIATSISDENSLNNWLGYNLDDECFFLHIINSNISTITEMLPFEHFTCIQRKRTSMHEARRRAGSKNITNLTIYSLSSSPECHTVKPAYQEFIKSKKKAMHYQLFTKVNESAKFKKNLKLCRFEFRQTKQREGKSILGCSHIPLGAIT